jgi:hypothetical protein
MSNFEGTAVRSLDDLVQFNRYHADLELPPGVFYLLPLFSLPLPSTPPCHQTSITPFLSPIPAKDLPLAHPAL